MSNSNFKFLLTEGNIFFLENLKPEIVIIAPTLDTVPSPNGNAIYDLVESLAKYSDFPILIVSRYFSGSPSSSISDRIVYFDFQRENNFFEKMIGYRGRKEIWGISNVLDIYYLKEVLKFLEPTSVKIVLLQDNASFFPAISKKWEKRFKFLHHQHNNALLGISLKKGNRFLHHLSEVIFVSKINLSETAKKFKNHSNKFKFIYNGIDLQNYPLDEIVKGKNLNTDTINLLFVGRIIPEKGIKELIKAVLALQNDNVYLKVIGNLNHSDGFIEEVKNLTACSKNRIQLCGTVSQSELYKFYNWSDFVVVPSIGKEGLPKVIFEALVMGKPVIASNRGGISEIITHLENGILINDPINSDSIRNGLLLAIQNISKLKEKVHVRVPYYRYKLSVEKMSENFDKIFSKYL